MITFLITIFVLFSGFCKFFCMIPTGAASFFLLFVGCTRPAGVYLLEAALVSLSMPPASLTAANIFTSSSLLAFSFSSLFSASSSSMRAFNASTSSSSLPGSLISVITPSCTTTVRPSSKTCSPSGDAGSPTWISPSSRSTFSSSPVDVVITNPTVGTSSILRSHTFLISGLTRTVVQPFLFLLSFL